MSRFTYPAKKIPPLIIITQWLSNKWSCSKFLVCNFWANSSKISSIESKVRENAKNLHSHDQNIFDGLFLMFWLTRHVYRVNSQIIDNILLWHGFLTILLTVLVRSKQITIFFLLSPSARILHVFCGFFEQKIFANTGRSMATYHQSFKGQGS